MEGRMNAEGRKLIVIRGPSGAGKSTVSKGVLEIIRSEGRLCAILEQDHFLNVIPGNQTHCRELCCDMMLACAIACRDRGYDVIMEGILNVVYCSKLFENLEENFGQSNVSYYYFDVSLEETQNRHLTRGKSKEFGPERMARWYKSASPTQFVNELIISSQSSAADTVQVIVDKYRRDAMY